MIDKLVIYRNELKNKSVSKYKLIGITAEVILSRDIFNNNKKISIFLLDVFNIEFKDYIMKSRTMVVAKIVRKISTLEDIDLNQCSKRLYTFIDEIINERKKTDTNSNLLDGWLK